MVQTSAGQGTGSASTTANFGVGEVLERIDRLEGNIQFSFNGAVGALLTTEVRGGTGATTPEREAFIPHPSLIRMLREFLGDASATFKTPEQAEALEIAMAGDRHLLLVGPTAMGKSLVYMLPAAQRSEGITCVMLPLSSLHLDFGRRCRELKIEYSRWLPGVNENPRTRIVFVSPEHAQRTPFESYLIGIARSGLLKHVVFDEVHLVKTQSTFRFCFSALQPLLRTREFVWILFAFYNLTLHAAVQFLMMTATCPPAFGNALLSELGVVDCHVIRAPTDRKEISYRVKPHSTLNEAKKALVGDVQAGTRRLKDDASFRGLVYCRRKGEVDELARLIGCPAFHADRPEEERERSFKDWVGGKHRFMVCTSLLGCGIDVEGVRAVFHFGTPWSILNFVQESGRGGRGGGPSISVVYAAEDEEKQEESEKSSYGKEAMWEWVHQQAACRRTMLGFVLDGRRVTCALLKGAALCDVCIAESKKPHPGKLVRFSTPEIPGCGVPAPSKLPNVPPTSLGYERKKAALSR